MTETELLPCPFCGGKPTIEVEDNGIGCFWIICDNVSAGCGCEGPYKHSQADAVAAWNTRASVGQVAVETLRKEVQQLHAILSQRPHPAAVAPNSDTYVSFVRDIEITANAIRDALSAALASTAEPPAYYCTDCENHIPRLVNDRCPCGSGRVLTSSPARPKTHEEATKVLALAEAALEPFSMANAGIQSHDPDFPDHGAALRASFDVYAQAAGGRRSVTRADIRKASDAFDLIRATLRAEMPPFVRTCRCEHPMIRYGREVRCDHCGLPPRSDLKPTQSGIDLATGPDTNDLVQSPPVEEAARRWRAARLAVVNLSIDDPEYRSRLNDLAEAEHALSNAVAKLEAPQDEVRN